MAENSRKNEFFERESIAMIAITTRSSIKVNERRIICIMLSHSCVNKPQKTNLKMKGPQKMSVKTKNRLNIMHIMRSQT